MSRLTQAIRNAATQEIRQTGDGLLSATFSFPADFPGFAGHFPGAPILPAVAQVQTAFCLVETGWGRPLRLTGVENAKFHLQLRPNQEITVELREKPHSGQRACEARLLRDGELASVFTLVLTAEEA